MTRYRILKDIGGYYWDCNLFPLLPWPRYSPYGNPFYRTAQKHKTLEDCENALLQYLAEMKKPVVVVSNIKDTTHADK